jgi:putative membrane protein
MFLDYLKPYEFSPTVLVSCLLAATLYARGALKLKARGERVGFGRSLSFYLGLVLIYLVLQSYFDYLSQHMFWVHRVQHLVLHHLGPFLVMLAVPHTVMAQALPQQWRVGVLRPLWRNRVTQGLYRFIQHPVIAPLLFVGLILFWLMPSVHFDAMLSINLYKAMNWSMAVDGLLFWWLILDPATNETASLGYGVRVLMLGIIMVPQILIGSFITLDHSVIYDVYNVCGRAWPVKPLVDQQIGGLTTWIPASMMSVIGAVVVLRLWYRETHYPQAEIQPAVPQGNA